MAVHKRLKRIRLEHNLSQSDFAQLANVSQPTIANWERGSHIPRRKKLESLAEQLHFDLLWLLSGDGDASRRLATPYLTQAIHHIPVYNWPNGSQAIESLTAVGHFPFAARKSPRFALRRPQARQGGDRIWIIDSRDNGESSQPNLVRTNGTYQILPHTDKAQADVIIGPVLASIYLYRRSDQG
jgi:transcriptional regulator with XRE-family HTH domain